LARTIHIQCIYGIFSKEITEYTVIYGLANPRVVACGHVG